MSSESKTEEEFWSREKERQVLGKKLVSTHGECKHYVLLPHVSLELHGHWICYVFDEPLTECAKCLVSLALEVPIHPLHSFEAKPKYSFVDVTHQAQTQEIVRLCFKLPREFFGPKGPTLAPQLAVMRCGAKSDPSDSDSWTWAQINSGCFHSKIPFEELSWPQLLKHRRDTIQTFLLCLRRRFRVSYDRIPEEIWQYLFEDFV